MLFGFALLGPNKVLHPEGCQRRSGQFGDIPSIFRRRTR
jgi:hypothetical protein